MFAVNVGHSISIIFVFRINGGMGNMFYLTNGQKIGVYTIISKCVVYILFNCFKIVTVFFFSFIFVKCVRTV